MSNAEKGTRLQSWKNAGCEFNFKKNRYFYRVKGEGEPLLMVHGFPTSSWDWYKVFEPLSRDFKVIAPDMLGFGFSEKPASGEYSCRAHAEFLEALLLALDVTNVHILTYSFGSSVVQQMMLNELDRNDVSGVRIKSITFLNGGLFPGSNHPAVAQKLLLSPLGGLVTRLMGRSVFEKNLKKIFGPDTQPATTLIDEYWTLLNRGGGRVRLPKLIGYLRDRSRYEQVWSEALVQHPAKQKLIVGMWDSISGAPLAAEYQSRVPGGTLITLDRIGHYPQLECPDLIVNEVRAWVLSRR